MIRLLALIPEPWGSLALVAVVVLAWAYGDVTGRGTERQKTEIARLSQANAILAEQQQTSLGIQTRMAERLSEMRLSNTELEKSADALIEEIRSRPRSGACILSPAQRMRLDAIRIGKPPAAAGAR